TIFFFYMLLNVAYFIVVPFDEIRSSGELVGALFFERVLGQGTGSTVLRVLIGLSAAGNVMVPHQPGNRAPGFLSLCPHPFIVQAVQHASWWPYGSSCAEPIGHFAASAGSRVWFYLGG